MKLPMPEPRVSFGGDVVLDDHYLGSVGEGPSGWWARISIDLRTPGKPFEAGGMDKRWKAVRWLVFHALDWRTAP